LNANYIVCLALELAGTDEQKNECFSVLSKEPVLASFALTESDAGSDVGSIRTFARRHEGGYVVKGSKCFITNGGLSVFYLLFAKTDKDAGVRGISAFITPGDSKGLSIAKKERKMGIRCSPTALIFLEDMDIKERSLLGKEGDGFSIAMQSLDRSKPVFSSGAVGLARAAYEYAIGYAQQREQFGRSIIKNQSIQFMFADMLMELEAARMLAWRAGWKVDQGLNATTDSAIAKCYATDMAMRVTTDCLQVLGGYGYMKDYPLQKMMRAAQLTQVLNGTIHTHELASYRNY
jgi:alkylation response protein AidB-like acyl-CoA dehydrogenase